MSSIDRKKISILFLTVPNLEELSLKYLVLSLNKIQSCFEFEFPDIENKYPVPSENHSDPEILLKKFGEVVKAENIKSEYFIGIVKNQIGNNWFWARAGNFGIITTSDWKKNYSPPSVLEYVIHSIVSLLVVMSDKSGILDSHESTRGCCLDYMRSKGENRVDTALGYICDECKSKILKDLGKKYLDCFETINSLNWLGDASESHTVANNLKKYFRVDLNSDTGYYKTRREKVEDYLAGLPKEVLSYSLSTSIGIIVGLVIAHLLGTG